MESRKSAKDFASAAFGGLEESTCGLRQDDARPTGPTHPTTPNWRILASVLRRVFPWPSVSCKKNAVCSAQVRVCGSCQALPRVYLHTRARLEFGMLKCRQALQRPDFVTGSWNKQRIWSHAAGNTGKMTRALWHHYHAAVKNFAAQARQIVFPDDHAGDGEIISEVERLEWSSFSHGRIHIDINIAQRASSLDAQASNYFRCSRCQLCKLHSWLLALRLLPLRRQQRNIKLAKSLLNTLLAMGQQTTLRRLRKPSLIAQTVGLSALRRAWNTTSLSRSKQPTLAMSPLRCMYPTNPRFDRQISSV